MHVFDDEKKRRLSSEVGQRGGHGVEQRRGFGGLFLLGAIGEHPVRRQQSGDRRTRLDQGGRDTGLLDRQPTESLTECQVRQCALAEVEAVADKDPPAGSLHLGAQLCDEATLADPGITTQQHVATDLVGPEAHEIG